VPAGRLASVLELARWNSVSAGSANANQRKPLTQQLNGQLTFLRSHKNEVSVFLRERETVPTMPPGVHLVSWELKEPPVVLEMCSVVTNTALFAKTTLEQLRTALANPRRWVGWSVPQLVDRLAQVGVQVKLDGGSEKFFKV
jgi:hypothetical protein